MRTPRSGTRRPSASLVVALLALFVALGGPAHAERLIKGSQLETGSVASRQVKDRSLRTRDLAPRTLRVLKAVPDASITPPKLAENSVSSRAIAPGNVLTGHIGDGSLTTADLGTNSVATDEVADDAIGQSEIRPNGVGTSELADNAVDGTEVIDGGLSVRDIARQVGTLQWPVGRLLAGACETKTVPITGIDIAGDFVLISPRSAWPADLVYTVNGTTSPTQFKVQACNRGALAVPEARYVFTYAVLAF